MIETAKSYVAIEEIQAGDMLLSENPETGDVEYKEVLETYENETEELIHVHVNGEDIVTTPSHPFYVNQFGWTRAAQLRAGDVLVLSNGEYVVVEFIQHEILESPVKVYNLEVDDYHTYFVGESSVLVHNGCEDEDTYKFKWGIHDIEGRKDGQGYWGKRVTQSNSRVDSYELKINPNNESYYLPHPNGGYVQFENMVNNTVQDGKLILKEKSFYHVNDLPSFASKKVLNEAQRQVAAAGSAGYGVEWLVSDMQAVEQLTDLFAKNQVNITVKYFPE